MCTLTRVMVGTLLPNSQFLKVTIEVFLAYTRDGMQTITLVYIYIHMYIYLY